MRQSYLLTLFLLINPIVSWSFYDRDSAIPSGYTSTTYYVSLSGSHMLPFDSWEHAATNLQSAVEISTPGSIICVTNGVYSSEVPFMDSVVALTNSILMMSVNGAAVTKIVSTNLLLRCAYLGTGSCIKGFTLAGGHAISGGGAFCEAESMVLDCLIEDCMASWDGGGVFVDYGADATLSNCWIRRCESSYSGGGLHGGFARHCRMEGNSSAAGGGVLGDVADSLIISNTAGEGGAALHGRLVNCTVMYNRAASGGACSGSTEIRNSILYMNSEPQLGVWYSSWGHTPSPLYPTYDHCYIGPTSHHDDTLNELGLLLHYDARLLPYSPCINAGDPSVVVSAEDYQGEPRVAGENVDIGCDEFHADLAEGPLSASITSRLVRVVRDYPLFFQARVEGEVSGMEWHINDTFQSPTAFMEYSNHTIGIDTIIFHTWNTETQVTLTTRVEVVSGMTNFVSLTGLHVSPFVSMETAATNIQDAVDAMEVAGGMVSVAPGLYATGFRVDKQSITNRVIIDKPVIVQAQNPSPLATIIAGKTYEGASGNMRCVRLEERGAISGFTLTGGNLTECGGYGGGVYCENNENVHRCCVVANQAAYGGGTANGTFHNCIIYSNLATITGGGCWEGSLHFSTVALNISTNPGTAGGTTWTDSRCSIIFHNTPHDTDEVHSGYLSCIGNGSGGYTYTNEPRFVDLEGCDFRLQASSPLIDTTYVSSPIDALDYAGIPRPLDGNTNGLPASDIGAYEFIHTLADSDRDGLTDVAEIESIGTNPVNADSDEDGYSDQAEIITGSDPMTWNARETLLHAQLAIATNIEQACALQWLGHTGRLYSVYYTLNLTGAWMPTDFMAIPGIEGMMSYSPAYTTSAYYAIQARMAP